MNRGREEEIRRQIDRPTKKADVCLEASGRTATEGSWAGPALTYQWLHGSAPRSKPKLVSTAPIHVTSACRPQHAGAPTRRQSIRTFVSRLPECPNRAAACPSGRGKPIFSGLSDLQVMRMSYSVGGSLRPGASGSWGTGVMMSSRGLHEGSACSLQPECSDSNTTCIAPCRREEKGWCQMSRAGSKGRPGVGDRGRYGGGPGLS